MTLVSQFTSKGIDLPLATEGASIARADLLFYGLDHSGASYEGRVFFDAKDLDHQAGADHPAYVGSFFIFGHGGCFGDLGHCDVPSERDPFDLRPPHQLEPASRILTVTQAIQRLVDAERKRFSVTLLAIDQAGKPVDALAFDKVRLATYL